MVCYAAFDCGTTNMALAVVDADGALQHWHHHSFPQALQSQKQQAIGEWVRGLCPLLSSGVVVGVEQQPISNSRMVAVQAALMGALGAMGVRAVNVSPRAKGVPPGTYGQRKAAAIDIARGHLQGNQQNTWAEWLDEHGKKDDLADALLLALALRSRAAKPRVRV